MTGAIEISGKPFSGVPLKVLGEGGGNATICNATLESGDLFVCGGIKFEPELYFGVAEGNGVVAVKACLSAERGLYVPVQFGAKLEADLGFYKDQFTYSASYCAYGNCPGVDLLVQ